LVLVTDSTRRVVDVFQLSTKILKCKNRSRSEKKEAMSGIEIMPPNEKIEVVESKVGACDTSTLLHEASKKNETVINTEVTPHKVEESNITLEKSSVEVVENKCEQGSENKPRIASVPILDENGKPLSKNQQKKRKRYEKLMTIKKRRKEQEKEAKAAKAKAAGRDLEAERRLQEKQRLSGEGYKRRELYWERRLKPADTAFRVCIDCSFADHMTPKEIGSLSSQIRYCYASNKKSSHPVHLSIASLSGTTYGNLSKVEGFPEQWRARAFSCSEEPLLQMHSQRNDVVYLTKDSENTLETLDDSKVYVIGGIVDRNRLKGITSQKSKDLNISTGKLPIDNHLKVAATKVLTCNHVFEILLKYREHDGDWKKALLDVLPERKEVQEV